jgi:CRISPR system Cascade subunit CasE
MIASILTLERADIRHLGKDQDAYTIHKLVYSLFPGGSRDFLYLDHGGGFGERKILILSHQNPVEPALGKIASKPVPEEFLKRQEFAFEVRLNPVVRRTGAKNAEPVKGVMALGRWFLERVQRWGFQVEEEKLEIFDQGIQVFTKGSQKILHNQAVFRGVLKVTDQDQFELSFRQGIGRGKAFGFGLLQLRPLK